MSKPEPYYRTTPKGEQYLRGLQSDDIKTRLANPTTRKQALDDLAIWVKDTALFFGCSTATAYKVAGVFVEGIEKDL